MVASAPSPDGPHPEAPLLVIDTGSPVTSVAFGTPRELLAANSLPTARSSSDILRLIDETLEQAETKLHRVGGLVALAGPGSFTGLRVGLATVLGLHQALGIPATTLSNLEVLAFSGRGDRELRLGAVDALRGEWFVQPFEGRASFRPAAEPVLVPADDLSSLPTGLIVGFGVSQLPDQAAGRELEVQEAGPLAPAALRLIGLRQPAWDAERLTRPLYLRPPAAKRAQRS